MRCLMKTLSRHLADNFPAEYQTRVEPQSNGNLVVRIGYPLKGTEAIRLVSDGQVGNGLLVETILEDMRNELARV